MADINAIKELIKRGDVDKAISEAKAYYETTKDDKVYNLYGIALMKKGEFKGAEKVFEYLYSKYQDNPKILINYSQALINLGQVEKAERLLREGAMLFPEEEKIYELINVCEEKKREKELKVEKKEPKEEKEPETKMEDFSEVSEGKLAREETETSESQEEELIEKIEEIKEEITEPREETKREETKWKNGKEYPTDREKISLDEAEDIKDEFLKRGRILEVKLFDGSEIILRETFIIFISGAYKVFPLKDREEGKVKESIFGGKNHKFLRIRGERCLVGVQAEYISIIDISPYRKFYVLEPYLIGFDASMRYDSKNIKVKGIGSTKLIELDGTGKVIIFTAGKKIMKKEYDDIARISLPSFVAICGESKVSFVDGSIEVKGSGLSFIRL